MKPEDKRIAKWYSLTDNELIIKNSYDFDFSEEDRNQCDLHDIITISSNILTYFHHGLCSFVQRSFSPSENS